MNGRSIAGHITALTVVLIGALIGCGVAPTPAPTPDPEGNGDPILSQMPTGALLERVTMPFTRSGTRADTPAEIKLNFAKGMNRESVEQAVNLYPAEIKRNDGTPKRLQVKAVCDGGWSIRNPNSNAVSFNWSISKSVERGEGMVAANGEQTLISSRGYKQLRIAVSGVSQGKFLSASGACVKTLEFTWAEDNKSVTVKPLKPMASDAITVSMSTAAFSSDGVRMVEPSSETLVPEQIIQANQAIALQFSQGVNKATLESSLKIYQGKFDSYDALEPTAPRVTNTCDGSYTVKNSGTQPLAFTWSIEGSSEKGAGNVAALSETKVTPSDNARAIKVFTDKGINVVRSLEGSAACNISFSSVWDASSASVKLSASSLWKLGSFTVIGSAVNEAGARIARDRLAVVHVVQDDTNGSGGGGSGGGQGEFVDDDGPIFPDQPLTVEIDEESFPPVAISSESTAFSAYASGDFTGDSTTPEPRVDWNFGDGSSAEGSEVEHTFAQPGAYTITVRVTDSSGVSDSVTQSIQVLPEIADIIPEIGLRDEQDTLRIDLGNEIPGVTFNWRFTDEAGTLVSQPQGTRIAQRLPEIGTYDVWLEVNDERELQSVRSSRSDPFGFPRPLIRTHTLVTRYVQAPKARFSSFAGGLEESIGGITPVLARVRDSGETLTATFNAEASTGYGELRYLWKIRHVQNRSADNSVEGEGRVLQHVFRERGEYIVTLTVEDPMRQRDTFISYVAIGSSENNIRLSFDYPDNTRSVNGAKSQSFNDAPFSSRTATQRIGRVQALEGDDYFPYVLYPTAALRRSATRWNDWANGSNFGAGSLCQTLQAFYSGSNVPFRPYVRDGTQTDDLLTGQQLLPNLICDFMTISTNLFPALQVAGDGWIMYTGRNLQTRHFDVIGGLRVPKVNVSVLPDNLISGKQASPLVQERRVTLNGEEHLYLNVVARQSDVKAGGIIEFDVPAYAVNAAGRRMNNANGLMFAKFEGENFVSGCEECVMENGRVLINVKVPTQIFQAANGRTISFDKVQLGNGFGCERDLNVEDSNLFKRMGSWLFGCTTVFTSSKLYGYSDSQVDFVPPAMPIYDEAEFTANANRVNLLSEEQRSDLWKIASKFPFAEVGNFLLDMIPFVRSVPNLVGKIGECVQASQQRRACDGVALALAFGGVAFDAATVFAGPLLKGAAKLYAVARTSSAFGKSFTLVEGVGKAIFTSVAPKILPLKTAFASMGEALASRLPALLRKLPSCGQGCVRVADDIIEAEARVVSRELAEARLNAFVERLNTSLVACGLQLAKNLLGTVIVQAGTTLTLQFTLGEIYRRFFSPSTPAREIDEAQPAPRTRAGQPGKFNCPATRQLTLESKYGYSATNPKSTNWNSVKGFIGQKTMLPDPANPTKLIPNLPAGYFPAKFTEGGNTFEYAFLPRRANGEVPILVNPKGADVWDVPNVPASKAVPRMADNKRYDALFRATFGPKKITASQIHHLLGDSVWRRNPMLRQVLAECNYHMDKGELLIELASDAVNAEIANRKYNFEADGVTPKANPEISKIIHRGQHKDFDDFAEITLKDQYERQTRTDFDGIDNWKPINCTVMIDVIKATANELRELFLRNTLNGNLLSNGVLK